MYRYGLDVPIQAKQARYVECDTTREKIQIPQFPIGSNLGDFNRLITSTEREKIVYEDKIVHR